MVDIDDLIKMKDYVTICAQKGIAAFKVYVYEHESPLTAARIILRMQDSDYTV